MKKIMKSTKGITLISLVVTIIILLILAGISIGMLSGDNGILKQAGNAKTQTDIAGEKEILQTASLAAISKEKYGELTKDKLDDELNNYSEIQNTEQTDNGIVVTFKSNRAYLVNSDGDVSSYSDITIGNLVVKDGNTALAENCKSVQLGKALTISFDASIANGQITSITPNIAYTTAGENSKTFTIVGKTSEGKEITKEYTVNLKGYYNIPELKVGDFVNYALNTPTEEQLAQLNNDISTYSGNNSQVKKTATGSTLLCRVLEKDGNGNPTKLISADGVNSLNLDGYNGYNNAVYLINEMCTILYSGSQGTTTNLKIEDLENRYFSSNAIETRNTYTTSEVKYGETMYYNDNNARYPKIAPEEAKMGIATTLVDGKNTIRSGGLNLSEQTITYKGNGNANASSVPSSNKGITVTQTAYNITQGTNNYRNATLNNIMHNSPLKNSSDTASVNEYWLSSRCVNTRANYCSFGVFVVNSGYIMYSTQITSSGTNIGTTRAIRPVISLTSGIKAEYSGAYNSTYNTWNLN